MAAGACIDPLSNAENGQAPSTPSTTLSNSSGSSKNKLPASSTNIPAHVRWPRWLFQAKSPKKQPKPQRAHIVQRVDSCPGGYPMLAAFLDSDENFMIYRRFGSLHSRLLLKIQDELREMENGLRELDDRDKTVAPEMLQCREDDENEARKQLLAKIESTVLRYGQILLQAQQLVLANRPADRDYKSVKNFFYNKEPLSGEDDEFIYHKEDLITLRPGRETAWVDASVERLLKILPRSAVEHLFCSKETALKSTDDQIRYFTKSRVEHVVNTIILISILVLLVLPVYALYRISTTFQRNDINTGNAIAIGILLVATLLFAAVLSLFTKARRHEILGASAAYCAILVVFIGNIGIQNVQTVTGN